MLCELSLSFQNVCCRFLTFMGRHPANTCRSVTRCLMLLPYVFLFLSVHENCSTQTVPCVAEREGFACCLLVDRTLTRWQKGGRATSVYSKTQMTTETSSFLLLPWKKYSEGFVTWIRNCHESTAISQVWSQTFLTSSVLLYELVWTTHGHLSNQVPFVARYLSVAENIILDLRS